MATFSAVEETAVLKLLLGRGYQASRYYPVNHLPQLLGLNIPRQVSDLYRLLQRYSARLLLYDLLKLGHGAELSDLQHYNSEVGARRILKKLNELKIVETDGRRFHTRLPETLRIGDFLEWWTAACLVREFEIPAIYNVSLTGSSTGGDYDVLGNWMGRLLLIEVKSAPPRGIHNAQINGFLNRLQDLLPDIAIFLVDTHLRMRDKVVLMFEEELIRRQGVGTLQQLPVERLSGQIFHIQHTIFIMNSKRDISRNFGIVFRDYLRYNLPVHRIFKC